MPKSADFDESRMAEACKVVLAQKKPNIAKNSAWLALPLPIASKARSPTTPTKSLKNALEPYQEKALTSWIVKMHSWNLPPNAGMHALFSFFYSIRVVEGGVVHDNHRLRFRPFSTVLEKLLNEILQYGRISLALEYSGQDNTVLCVRWQDLSLVTVEFGYLQCRQAQRRPASAPESDSFVTSRLIRIDQIIRFEML
jgi:hypothetical protein